MLTVVLYQRLFPGNTWVILGLINLQLPWLQTNIVGLVPNPNLSPALLQVIQNWSQRSGNEARYSWFQNGAIKLKSSPTIDHFVMSEWMEPLSLAQGRVQLKAHVEISWA